ncbi:hypothetical protein IR083_05190 [Dysgonomonas sp. GY75]|uniref:hypothetical protein n=1 Tax=Dysgonomonas sp. GY75 TaxID=2780419 RepID=UPI0018840E13|nr:hypothetical protein [Dysgonomonas sp. GY75]MBF0648202.1 hypothetical protein [Dysgonomonas sp. GY75]
MRKYILLAMLIASFTLHAQENSLLIDTLYNRIARQLTLYPQEKLHLHIDKSVYRPGDTLWLQPYIVHSVFHIPYAESRYVYTELINPFDSVIYRAKVRMTDSILGGYIPIPMNIENGNYALQAYTRHMENLGKDYFFRRGIKIYSTDMSRLKTYMRTQLESENKSKISLKFTDNLFRTITPLNASLKLKDSNTKQLKIDEDRSILIDLDMNDRLKNKSMKINFSDQSGYSYSTFLPVTTDKQDYDVSFFPEGGYLINGAPCKMAFKALGINGHSVDIRINIIDSTGDILASDSTIHEGMGIVEFIPQQNQKYQAHCTNKFNITRIYNITTEVTEAGLRVDVEEDSYKITLQRPSDALNNPYYFIAHVRGAIIYADWWIHQD